jgi:hypothetical protein
MRVTLEIPDDIAKAAGDTSATASRKMIEQYALSQYAARRIGHFGVQRLLGFDSWQETEKFLRDNKAPLQYDIREFEADMETARKVFGQ